MIMQVPYMPYTRIMDRLLVIEDSADLSRIGRGAMKGNIIFFNRFLYKSPECSGQPWSARWLNITH